MFPTLGHFALKRGLLSNILLQNMSFISAMTRWRPVLNTQWRKRELS
jgi:hypothetical protein